MSMLENDVSKSVRSHVSNFSKEANKSSKLEMSTSIEILYSKIGRKEGNVLFNDALNTLQWRRKVPKVCVCVCVGGGRTHTRNLCTLFGYMLIY